MLDFPLQSLHRAAEIELNLCAITSLLHEAQRIEAKIRSSQRNFWTIFPQAQTGREIYQRGFAAYKPSSGDEVGEFSLGCGDDESVWEFEAASFPHTVARRGNGEILPVFYESCHPLGHYRADTRARAFVVEGDEVIEVASLEGSTNPRITRGDGIEIYNIYGNNFSYGLRKMPFNSKTKPHSRIVLSHE